MSISYEDLQKATGSDNAKAINLASDTALSPPALRLWIGGTGNVKVDTPNQTAVTYTAVPTGVYLFVHATKVYSSGNGTTASNIVAEW